MILAEKKVCKLKRLLNSPIQNKSSSYLELARIAGSIISVALAIVPISRLLTKQMYLTIESIRQLEVTCFSSHLLC